MSDDIEDGQRRRWWRVNGSVRSQGNRVVYALVAGWLFWLAFGRPSEWLILAIALPVYMAESAYCAILDRQAGTDRHR